jgi:hypothetical protein
VVDRGDVNVGVSVRGWQTAAGNEVDEEAGGHSVAGPAVIRPISARQPSTFVQYHEDRADIKGKDAKQSECS